MKLVRFLADNIEHYGILEGDIISGLKHSYIEDNGASIDETDGNKYHLSEVRLLTPCVPTKYLGVGLNFEGAAAAMNRSVPSYPITFIKPTDACIATKEDIEIELIDDYDYLYEGELAVVIGKKAKNVPEHEAMSYVLGYTCSNDITARHWFGKDDLKLKAADTFGPIGPCIETEMDAFHARIRSWINGELRQDGNTEEMIFNIPYMISFFSSYMTLLPGDVISMGTPAGAGNIKPGDKIVIEVDGVGKLENTVKGINV